MPAKPVVGVVTADIIQSTSYVPSDRLKIDQIIRSAFKETSSKYPNAFRSELDFRVTAGDEFQFVIRDVHQSFQILTYFRAVTAAGTVKPFVRFRASIGIGRFSVGNRNKPYENDGEAFVRSRQGLENITNDRTPVLWTTLQTGRRDDDAVGNALLGVLDAMQQSWTVRQWEAVRWSLIGSNRLDSAKRLKIRHQNVSKRLKGAGWAYFEIGAQGITTLLSRIGT